MMDTYRLMVIHWSIFTLSVQLIYCASVYSNLDIPLQISSATNAKLTSNTESLCNDKIERFVDSEGRNSSLTLDLHPGLMTHGLCKRILSAPESHGFLVRLTRPKDQRKTQSMSSSSSSLKNLRRMGPKIRNSTRSCPLSIFSTNDPLTPSWRIDPCQLEARSEQEEPVRLLQGRLRITWDHGGNAPPYKLVITVLGKGRPCQDTANKHPCLRFGTETLLCISKDLVCDGVRHCPNGNEYDSDEDTELCASTRRGEYETERALWQHITNEIFRNLLNTESTVSSPSSTLSPEKTAPNSSRDSQQGVEITLDDSEGGKRNVTKGSITGDLSKYGPWGYLMLGMLLCGGALLICGLWECCCRQNKPNGETSGTNEISGVVTGTGNENSGNNSGPDPAPPNYDELDPPPAYSVLFPNQKALNDSDASSELGTDNPGLEPVQTSSS